MAKVLINLDYSVRGLKANWEAGWAARLTGLRNAFSRKFEFGPAPDIELPEPNQVQ